MESCPFWNKIFVEKRMETQIRFLLSFYKYVVPVGQLIHGYCECVLF